MNCPRCERESPLPGLCLGGAVGYRCRSRKCGHAWLEGELGQEITDLILARLAELAGLTGAGDDAG
jgi:hypothetical protein